MNNSNSYDVNPNKYKPIRIPIVDNTPLIRNLITPCSINIDGIKPRATITPDTSNTGKTTPFMYDLTVSPHNLYP